MIQSSATVAYSYDLIVQCRRYMAEHNCPIEEDLIIDGKIHRFSRDHKRRDRDEWYLGSEGISQLGNSYMMVTFGSWSDGQNHCFKSWERGGPIDRREMEELRTIWKKKQRDDEIALKQVREEAAKEANAIWDRSCSEAPSENYLYYVKSKKIEPIGLRFGNNPNGYPACIIPFHNGGGEVRTLQFISQNTIDQKSYKTWLSGAQKRGNFFLLGEVRAESTLYITEGYATAVTCHMANGEPTIMAGDSGNIDPVINALLNTYKGARIVIVGDGDEVGKAKANEAARKYGCSVVFPVFPKGRENDAQGNPYTDFNDLQQVCGIVEVKNQLGSSVKDVVPPAALVNKNTSRILEMLRRNEVGDAELFVDRFGSKYVFDPTEGKQGRFFLWKDGRWELDIAKQIYIDFDEIAEEYALVSNDQEIDEDIGKNLKKRAHQLRTNQRRKHVLETVSAKLTLKKQWDYCPGFLPCTNGMVNLQTGELIPNCPEQYIRKVCPYSYQERAVCPRFESFLDDITLGNSEVKVFIARVLGYAILGIPREERIFYLYGLGRNGKGTLMKLLQDILGPLARTFPSEMILLQKNPPSSSSPSPELANLEGVRLAIFSEVNKGRQIDAAKVKNLSGRDRISCRRLFSNHDLQIDPTHTMFIQTNYKPKAPSDDVGLWHRNILLPFQAHFTEEPKKASERRLNEKLKEELLQEAEGILSWIVRGCLEYNKMGLQIPASVQEKTDGYRKENDGIGSFLEDRCTLAGELCTPSSVMIKAITDYCQKEGYNTPNRLEITEYLSNRFQKKSTNKANKWIGVGITPEGVD